MIGQERRLCFCAWVLGGVKGSKGQPFFLEVSTVLRQNQNAEATPPPPSHRQSFERFKTVQSVTKSGKRLRISRGGLAKSGNPKLAAWIGLHLDLQPWFL